MDGKGLSEDNISVKDTYTDVHIPLSFWAKIGVKSIFVVFQLASLIEISLILASLHRLTGYCTDTMGTPN